LILFFLLKIRLLSSSGLGEAGAQYPRQQMTIPWSAQALKKSFNLLENGFSLTWEWI